MSQLIKRLTLGILIGLFVFPINSKTSENSYPVHQRIYTKPLDDKKRIPSMIWIDCLYQNNKMWFESPYADDNFEVLIINTDGFEEYYNMNWFLNEVIEIPLKKGSYIVNISMSIGIFQGQIDIY